MPDNEQTINEEAGLPENWVPVDRPPVDPGRANPNSLNDGNLKYLQGTLPPTYQHDSSFVNTAYKSDTSPSSSLVPLSLNGNPTTNAAIQSTSTITPSSVPSGVTTTLSVNVPAALFTPAFQDIALPGTLTLDLSDQSANQFFAGPTTGSPAAPTWRAFNLLDFGGIVFPVANGGTGVATLPIHEVIVGNGTSPVNSVATGTAGQVLTSNGASADPTFQTSASPSAVVQINGAAAAIDRQVYINGVTDGSAVWTFQMNGTPDGG